MNKLGIYLLLAAASLPGCGTSSGTPSGSAYTTGSVYETSRNTVTTIAGSAGTSGTTDATGTAATFTTPNGIVVSTDKTTLYVTDASSNTIRRIQLSTGAVTTLAGSAGVSGSTDAIGTAATFNTPHDIATDGASLYVTDVLNNTIRKIDISSGTVSTLAGKAGVAGTADGQGTAATFNGPLGIACDGTSLYVTDSNSNTIRMIDIATRTVTTLAGTPGAAGSANGTGATATFNLPAGIATDGTNLYVADFNNNMIRTIAIASKAVTTLAGSTSHYGSADGTGANASFYSPIGVATDGANLYVTDKANNIVRKIVISSGTVTTVAGSPRTAGSSDGVAAGATFNFPVGIATDGTNLYIADAWNSTIRKIQ